MNFQTRKIFVLKNKTKQQQKKKKNLFPFVLSALPLRDGRERAALLNIHTKRKRKKRQKLRIPPPPFPTKEQKRRTTSLNSTNEIQSIVLVDDSLGILYYFFRASFSKRK